MRWQGCYDESWKGLIVPEAFGHPAKMARGLLCRIFDYLFENGHLRRGDLVVDPFGGIGSTGIIGASRGLRVVCCELEPKFVALAEQNFELHRHTWTTMGDPLPRIVCGDSRRLAEVLAGEDCVVGSPPFSGSEQPCASQSQAKKDYHAFTRGNGTKRDAIMTGSSPGQSGAMPPGTLAEVIVSSPPYAEGCLQNGGADQHPENIQGGKNGHVLRDYGSADGQLAALPAGRAADCLVSSPPYEESLQSTSAKKAESIKRSQIKYDRAHGKTSSESYRMTPGAESMGGEYGVTEGNLGNSTGDTFWAASKIIVQQCWQILRPNGIAVFVCKDFIRAKKRVPFSDDWRKLCEACGFELVEWIKASLVKETTVNGFFGAETERTQRKSFFRRLAEKKGSPRIDHEDVLVLRKV